MRQIYRDAGDKSVTHPPTTGTSTDTLALAARLRAFHDIARELAALADAEAGPVDMRGDYRGAVALMHWATHARRLAVDAESLAGRLGG